MDIEKDEWFENEHNTHPRIEEIVKVKLGDGTRELYAIYAPLDTPQVIWFSVRGPINQGPVKKWRRIPISEIQEWQPKFDEAIALFVERTAREGGLST